jgi:hypothetical protein
MDIQDTNSQALATVDRLNAVAITTTEQYADAGELWKVGREMMDQISEAYDSIISAAHRAHKEAVAKKKSFYDPVESATKRVKALMIAFDAEQERQRQAEARRLEAEARRQEEEHKLAEALAAEAAGDAAGADEILNEPIAVAPVFVEPATPKIAGIVFQTRWNIKVTDPDLVPREFMVVDEKKLRQLAVALKGQFNVPGVMAYSEKV